MAAFLRAAVVLATVASSTAVQAGLRGSSKVTPVEKVVQLLTKLQAQVEKEGQTEAAAYDKYACFCKEQASNKQYAIEQSTERIANLDALILKLTGEITQLNTEATNLQTTITGLETEMDTAQAVRDTQRGNFTTDVGDVDNALDAIKRAIQALKESKGDLKGHAEKEALAQVQAVALTGALELSLSETESKKVEEVFGQPGEAYEYSYHSNDIISTLEMLLDKFQAKKAQIEQEEFDTKTAFEKRQLDMTNEKNFAEKDRKETLALADKKTEEKEASETDRTQETNEMTADKSFLAVIVQDCEGTAKLWDQRSQSRADELRAMADAISALKDGVAPNWQANKKLVGIQRHTQVATAKATVQAAVAPKAMSFLQQRQEATKKGVSKKVADALASAAQVLKSPMLSAAALKVSLSEDHFVKVRQIIKDLVQRLKQEAKAEQTQKSFCDQEMASALSSRDTAQQNAEGLEGQIAKKEAEKAALKQEVAVLSQEIAQNQKELAEATELRNMESVENEKTVSEAGAGREAVERAIQVLQDYYKGTSFLQGSYVPPNSDREGSTVGDLAPEIFDSEYNGNQEASKGIIGLLEVILSDFDRTDSTVTSQEAQAVTDFTVYKTDNEENTKLKQGLVVTKEGEIADLEDDLITHTDDLATEKNAHQLAVEELEKLKTMCVEGEETYEERVAKRKAEIEALKEAHDILENWST